MKLDRWRHILEASYKRAYDACLPMDGSNHFGFSTHASGTFHFRVSGEAEEDAFYIGKSLKEFEAVHSTYRKAVALDAVYQTYLDSDCSIEALQVAAVRSVEKWRKLPTKLYQTWIHLDVPALPEELQSITINGQSLTSVTGAEFYPLLSNERLEHLKHRSGLEEVTSLRTFVTSKYRATNSSIALEAAIADFSILRAVLNWHPKLRTRSYTLGSTQEACEHYPPLVYGVTAETGEVEAYPGYGATERKSRPVSTKHIDEIVQMLSFFGPKLKRGSVRHLLSEAMALGSAGLDSIYPDQQFLACWTALERLALVDKGNSLDVARRIPRLWVDAPGGETQFLLELFASERNEFVHEGRFDPEDHMKLGLLRDIVASAFWRLHYIAKDVPTITGLREYFASSRLTKQELRDRAKGAKFASTMRDDPSYR